MEIKGTNYSIFFYFCPSFFRENSKKPKVFLFILNAIDLIFNLLNPIVSNSGIAGISDEDALDQFLLTQNTNYFNLLYDRYTNKVYSKCITMLKEQDQAEDAAQEIFVKVLLSSSKFSGKSKFSTWLYSITYNYCIDVIRRKKKENATIIDEFGPIDLVDDTINDAEIIETNIFRLKEVLTEMNSMDMSILLMKYQDDLSIKEICEATNKTESAVKMKILRAKERFLKIYQTKYGQSG